MDDANVVAEVIRSLGPAGATFAVMWLWLSSERKEKQALQAELSKARQDSTLTLERVLPLVAQVSQVMETSTRDKEQQERDRTKAMASKLEDLIAKVEGRQ